MEEFPAISPSFFYPFYTYSPSPLRQTYTSCYPIPAFSLPRDASELVKDSMNAHVVSFAAR